jgi:hypothetical protein
LCVCVIVSVCVSVCLCCFSGLSSLRVCVTARRRVKDELAALNSAPTLCGKSFEVGEAIYTCRDCANDSTCVLCAECFKRSEHKSHNYTVRPSSATQFPPALLYC